METEESRPGRIRATVLLATVAALAVAAAVWLPLIHLFFVRPIEEFHAATGLSPKSRALAARHLRLWRDPAARSHEIDRLRASNEEWDFMGRTFFVLSLANVALRDSSQYESAIAVIDTILRETLLQERQHGPYAFLLPYAKSRKFVMQPAHSLFVDSEIMLMLGARRMLRESPEFQVEMSRREEILVDSINANRLLAAESYPNECWTFDHAAALAALKIQDALDHTDHSAIFRNWLSAARSHLIHRESGLLISCYDLTGQPIDGPEGSTIWLVAHCLHLIDHEFAEDQYRRARAALGDSAFGFAYAHEWPRSWRGQRDIDSGPIVPVLDISAGASGMALMGAAEFQDWEYLRHLAATLDMAAFPDVSDGRLKYCASNQVGDAVVLYASVLGPLWAKVETKSKP